MLILCLGSEYFHDAFQRLGHTVLAPPHKEGYPVDALFNNLRDRPDLIVYTDHLGIHGWPEGIADLHGVPRVYYAVDTPINLWWQRHFARLFDYVFADQKPCADELSRMGMKAGWLPVGVDAKSYLPSSGEDGGKIYDFGFVGVMDEARRPKRARLMSLISQRYSVKTAGSRGDGWVGPGESGQLYRQSKLALNENLFPGVTMRMLEAMASGAVLFTEKAGGDLGEMFTPGEDFAWFDPPELLDAAETWLNDEKLRKRAARRASEKVQASHDVTNRAETFLQAVQGVNPGTALSGKAAADEEGRFLFLTALRWPREDGQKRMARAEKLFRDADSRGELSPAGLFMLGHIQRLRKRPEDARGFLVRAWEAGETRGALGMGILSLALQDTAEAAAWLSRFTGVGEFPHLTLDTLSFPAVKLIAGKLLEQGEDVCPGFSRSQHDPAVWTAFEFYLSAFRSDPSDLETARALCGILLNRGAAAEALEFAQKALEHHPEDEVLGAVFAEAGKATYLTVNMN
ncbi:MAG: glycosyltransferase [Deltaproteobacteria bacterium]|jgi:tetratricopeptide (TPR) repeat protein|nr:glycosyltransferase [Deltaproteobacteria bacterium]